MWRGLIGFLLFWLVALAAGVLLALAATGASLGWVLLAIAPLALLGVLAWRDRRSARKMPEDRDVER